MNFPKLKVAESFPQFNLDQQKHHLVNLQHHLQHNIHQALNSLHNIFLNPPNPRFFFNNNNNNHSTPLWARIPSPSSSSTSSPSPSSSPVTRNEKRLSSSSIEERLAGVPVYALTNSLEEFVLVSSSGSNSSTSSLALFCFKKEDADALLDRLKNMDPGMRRGSSVVAVALNKVVQLKVDGVAFRLIPDSSQVKNALRERERVGQSEEGFLGVPVFQSRSLILRSQNRTYRPAFFTKEDLEKSLKRAAEVQNKLNPMYKHGDVQVAVLEDIIKGLKEGPNSEWNDVVFVPPGFDVSIVDTQK